MRRRRAESRWSARTPPARACEAIEAASRLEGGLIPCTDAVRDLLGAAAEPGSWRDHARDLRAERGREGLEVATPAFRSAVVPITCAPTAIRKRAKANGWTRDLSGAVRAGFAKGLRGGSREPARRGNAFRGRHRRCGGARDGGGALDMDSLRRSAAALLCHAALGLLLESPKSRYAFRLSGGAVSRCQVPGSAIVHR